MHAVGPVAAAVERLRAGLDRPVVVALDGHSTAGKTTLAAALAERLDAAVVHGDDFYRDIPEVERPVAHCVGGRGPVLRLATAP